MGMGHVQLCPVLPPSSSQLCGESTSSFEHFLKITAWEISVMIEIQQYFKLFPIGFPINDVSHLKKQSFLMCWLSKP